MEEFGSPLVQRERQSMEGQACPPTLHPGSGAPFDGRDEARMARPSEPVISEAAVLFLRKARGRRSGRISPERKRIGRAFDFESSRVHDELPENSRAQRAHLALPVATPQAVRSWVERNLPEGITSVALDFPSVSGRGGANAQKLISTQVAILKAEIPSHLREEFARFCLHFEEYWSLPLLLSPASRPLAAMELLKRNLNLRAKGAISAEDIPELHRLINSRACWRKPFRSGPVVDMASEEWMSIDPARTMFREDLILVSGRDVYVAQPDITRDTSSTDFIDLRDVITHRAPDTAFVRRRLTEAWVVRYRLTRSGLVPSGDPFRAIVANKHEYDYRDTVKKEIPGYADLCKTLGVSSAPECVSALMVLTQKVIGDFIMRNGLQFLVRKDAASAEGHASILKSLKAAGIPAEPEDLESRLRTSALVRLAIQMGTYEAIPALMSLVLGEPLVQSRSGGRCAIKAQRGSLEQINQWLLAAVVGDNKKCLPDFIGVLAEGGATSNDVAAQSLHQYETERHLTGVLKMLIKTLSRQGQEMTVKVVRAQKDVALCECSDLKRWAFVRGSFKKGQVLTAELGAFNLEMGKFEMLKPRVIGRDSAATGERRKVMEGQS